MVKRLSAALLLLLAAASAQTVRDTPFAGIAHIQHQETAPRELNIHVVLIDLAQPGLRFSVTPPSGSRETVRQTTVDFLRTQGAQLAINAHFFEPYPSEDTDVFLIGAAAANGTAYSDFESPRQSYALLPNAPALNLDADNHAQIVHRGDDVGLYNAISGSAQIVTDGVKTIPQYGEGGLTPGQGYTNEDSWYNRLRARTVIGVTRDALTLVLFTVDEAGGSRGMTVGEAADFLIANYGVWNALNLDGGGSTSLAIQDPQTQQARLLNAPTGGGEGRSIGSSLAVFAPPR